MSKFFVEGNPTESESESGNESEEQEDEKKIITQKKIFRDVETSESEEERGQSRLRKIKDLAP